MPATAPAQVQPYQANDYGGFRSILPPGTNGTFNATDFARSGWRHLPAPRHRSALDVREPGLRDARPDRGPDPELLQGRQLRRPAGQVERTYSPRAGVTIVRDSNFGVAHIYGVTRSDTIFGAGYAGAEDRLFFMDVLRHAGRGQLSASPAARTRRWTPTCGRSRPTPRRTCRSRSTRPTTLRQPRARQLQQDLADYVAGINQYISEARTDPTKMPYEYAAIGKPLEDWQGTDVIATASLIGGIFGKGGGNEIGKRGRARGGEGPLRRRRRRAGVAGLPPPGRPGGAHDREERQRLVRLSDPARQSGVALPDEGSLVDPPNSGSNLGLGPSGCSAACGLLGGMSNALLVSGAESESGRPVAVMGPQVAYFMPQILVELDLHGPDIDAQGAAFPGVSPYVLLGRGQDYAWSATSAGQDIIDTFAEKLCEPDGSAAGRPVDALPLQGRVPADGDPHAGEQHHAEPGRPLAARDLHARGAAHGARDRLQARHRRRAARRVRAPALDLLPRGRLGPRVLRPQPAIAGAERRGLPAGGAQDQLHLQLVLRGRS